MGRVNAQTATEYLVITAVVIIISLIVVGVLAGSPGVGSTTDVRVNMAELRSEKIGTETFAVNDNETVLILRNNLNKDIQITQILIAGIVCDDPSIPITLTSGKKTTVNCDNINTTSDDFNLAYQMSYQETSGAGGSYTLELPNLIGSAGDNVTGGAVELGGGPTYDGCFYRNSTGVGDGLFYNGTGTVTAPYGICNCTMLQDLNQTVVLGANVTLVTNIDCSDSSTWNGGYGFSPIGTCGAYCGSIGDNPYVGRFYGQSYNITGLYQAWYTSDGIGLFGNTYESSTVNGRIYDVGVQNDVTGDQHVGGLVGYARYTNISGSFTSGSVTAAYYGGGIAGWTSYGNITNSYSSSTVSGGDYVGGLVGMLDGGILNNSYATGTVSGGSSLGGLAGGSSSPSTIDNSYYVGSLSGGDYTGGIMGYAYYVTVMDVYALANVTCAGSQYCGGVFGQNTNSQILPTTNWTNYTGDTTTGCVGQSGTLVGTSNANCTTITP